MDGPCCPTALRSSVELKDKNNTYRLDGIKDRKASNQDFPELPRNPCSYYHFYILSRHIIKVLGNMDPNEFEARYKEQVREILNRLQSAMLVSSQLEASIAEIGEAVQGLSRDVEQFLIEQRSNSGHQSLP
jgi:hypothetical protein